MKLCVECEEGRAEVKSRCRSCYNSYMRKYMNARYHRRRSLWLDRLGGECVECGSKELLNFDHIDASSKTCDVAKILGSGSEAKVLEEMAKCQLLCEKHHLEKSLREGDIYNVGHGEGVTGKRNCRCSLCGPLKNEYLRKFKASKV